MSGGYFTKHALERCQERGIDPEEVITALTSCRIRGCGKAEPAMKYFRAFGIPLSEIRPDLWPPAYGKAIAAKQKAVEQASPAMSANGDQDEETE